MSVERKNILEVERIVKQFPAEGGRQLTACNEVSLSLCEGETLGIVGESGCGKSTLVKLIMQLFPPTSGSIQYRGQDITALRGEALRRSRKHIQMVFQDPAQAFNPKMKIKDILCEPLRNFGLIPAAAVLEKAKALLRLVELPEEFAERYPSAMSGGQRQRIGIARALALEPDILVCDEATSALDVSVQNRIAELLAKLQRKKNLSNIFICHDVALVSQLSHRIAVMYLGHIVEVLDGAALYKALHPYTKALLRSIFPVRSKGSAELSVLEGEIPSPLELPTGCPFQSRCTERNETCGFVKPLLREVAPGHMVACHLAQETVYGIEETAKRSEAK